MKATKIYYQKCFNLGNYQNEVIGVELEIEAGEKAIDVLERAKLFVNSRDIIKAGIDEYNRCLNIVSNPDDHTGREVKEANEFIARYTQTDDLPF